MSTLSNALFLFLVPQVGESLAEMDPIISKDTFRNETSNRASMLQRQIFEKKRWTRFSWCLWSAGINESWSRVCSPRDADGEDLVEIDRSFSQSRCATSNRTSMCQCQR